MRHDRRLGGIVAKGAGEEARHALHGGRAGRKEFERPLSVSAAHRGAGVSAAVFHVKHLAVEVGDGAARSPGWAVAARLRQSHKG